ncbi:apolipoprotein N-acyltransferase [Methylobacterium gnaphalii]|uniref:Apolipoprotein N-acyltransferase n=1 Tax=Methylobacterium gnaphalii TaxID=1010610 RepID=A0A512JPU6_9HYPH|nr:apolipoprotein N-acyltransferase [Methylobacterium gnaphalii]GEP11968.1 apolipoprotein N-acyltransferase [Methylobacterium gnaphalii]GJD68683.1 Apolipoprotein N-acyltransferase [Methylobacterium gnaphalii]GLS49420.1 apolipoprotein N-acyltransferase [Methylobacterium gnaphalii]
MTLARNSDAHIGLPIVGWLESIAHRIILSHGWTRFGLAVAAGAIGALAMPPYGMLPALALSLTVAVWLIDGASAGPRGWCTLRDCALIGWAWGFGYFVAGLWWLGAAFLVEADQFAWAMPLGVVGLPAVLAVFYALGFAAARLVWSRGIGRLFALAFGLAGSEWLRGHLFTGFPWNNVGMALGGNLWLMQGASLVGLYGLSLIVVPIAAAPAALVTGASPRARFGPVVAGGLVLAVLALFGAWRVPSGPDATIAGVRLRLIQPNIQQDEKFGPEARDSVVDKYLELSDRATSPERSGIADVTHIVWPESAFPFLIQRDPQTLGRIGAVLPKDKHLITGAARAQEPLTREHAVFFNSILTIEHGGTLGQTYDKVHLVPFGEYLPGPFDAILRALGLRQFVSVPGGFTPGSRAGQRILPIPGLPPVAATICYESIFPGAIVPADAADAAAVVPGLILNLTNDAWFGDTPGPHQHFAQARLRAVEEGLPLVRDANSGISAVVDAHGRIVAALPLGQEGVLDAELPARIPGRTVYAHLGDVPFAAMLLCAVLIAFAGRRRDAQGAA